MFTYEIWLQSHPVVTESVNISSSQGKEVERGSVILPREAEIAAKNPKLNKQDAHYKIR